MKRIVDASVGALGIAGSLCGVPFVGAAALALQDIVKTSEDVLAHKRKTRQMIDKCIRLMNILNDQSAKERLEGLDIQQAVDEVTEHKILKRLRNWSSYSRAKTWWCNAEIGNGLEQCLSELDTAMGIFQANSHMLLHISQREVMEAVQSNRNEMRELLLQVLSNKAETQRVIDMQNGGEHVAESLMEAGQLELLSLRQNSYDNANLQSISPSPQISDSQRYLQYQRGLINLHRLTGIPPTVKVLNGEVSKSGDLAVAGGTYSDIWEGIWLGAEKVALKALRNIKASDPKAQKGFLHEINVWSNLKNDHILPFYGIVTDLGQHIHMVSPWQEFGNILNYVKIQPLANRIHLIYGAAQGLEYLHSCNIIHGNVKCANILVTSTGDASMCDFGMSKIIEEVTEKSASATLTAAGSARWLAPELIEGVVSSPTMAADTYSFAMAILELLTGKHPFADCKRDASVIHNIVVLKRTPFRPTEDSVRIWLTDDLWELMQSCWNKNAWLRPLMTVVTSALAQRLKN